MLLAARLGTTQAVAYTGTAAPSSAFGSQCYQIRVVANSSCHIAIGPTGTAATTSSPYLPAHAIDYLTVNPGEIISAIRAATAGLDTATSGTLWVSELS